MSLSNSQLAHHKQLQISLLSNLLNTGSIENNVNSKTIQQHWSNLLSLGEEKGTLMRVK